jgi:hypothetical protein
MVHDEDEEWMSSSQESTPKSAAAEKCDQHSQQPPANDVHIAIPSDDDSPNEIEVVVDEDSSQIRRATSLTDLNCILHGMTIWPTYSKSCTSSAIRKRRCLLVTTLLVVAALLVAVVIAVPVATKVHVSSVESFHAPSDPINAGDDDGNAYEQNESEDKSNVTVMATSANEYDTTPKVDEEKRVSSTVVPEIDNETMTASTAVASIENQLDIDQITGEEVADSFVSTRATSSVAVDTQLPPVTISIAATFINSNVDENTGEEVYKEPIFDSYQQIPQDDASNDISISAMSTVRPTDVNEFQTSPIPESQAPSLTNDIKNSIDGIISIHMSPNDENNRDSLWLEAHNTRRKQWHKGNNVTYVPLSWSTDLVSSALKFAQVLIDQPYGTMELYHDETNHQEGENLARNCGTGGSYTSIRTPDSILERWVEREVGMSPPNNLHLIQVLWRATTLVGCAEAKKEYEDGSVCHVQVCRYSKMGNCNLGKYEDWSIPMLLDDSPC